MKIPLVKRLVMYYPFFRLEHAFYHRFFALALVLLAVMFFPRSAQAQSDTTVALQFRRDGLACQEKGDFSKALFYYEHAAMLLPQEPAVFNDIGLMNEKIGRSKDAETNYLKAIKLGPQYLPAYANLGEFYKDQGQDAMAVLYLRKRVQMGRSDDPWTLRAQELLEQIYHRAPVFRDQQVRQEADDLSQRLVRSRERARKVAQRDAAAGFEMAFTNGLNFLEQHQYDQAIDALTTAVSLDPRSADARHALARAQYDKEKSGLDRETVILKEETRRVQTTQTLDALSAR